MNEELYNKIKEVYGKHSSWAIWDIPFSLGDYQKVKDRIKPNIVLVGLNPSGEIKYDFGDFHIFENKYNTPCYTLVNTMRLIHAFEDTDFEGAYMTDIIKNPTNIKDIKDDIKNDPKYKKDIKNHPKVKENIETFKEELKLIGSKDPLIIVFGNEANEILSGFQYPVYKVTHYAARDNTSCEEYKNKVWEEINLHLTK